MKQRTFYLECLAAGLLLGMGLSACSNEEVLEQVDATETTASAWTISVANFPSMGATTRADDNGDDSSDLNSDTTGSNDNSSSETPESGENTSTSTSAEKAAWENGDEIEVTFNGDDNKYSLVCQEDGTWIWKDDKAPESTDYSTYTAVYKGGGADYEDGLYEYLTAEGNVSGTALSISLTRNYSRLRITNIEATIGEGAPLTVNFPEGKYTSPEGKTDITSLKVTTDQGGYCVYGTFEEGCRVNVEYGLSSDDTAISGKTGYSLISAQSCVFKINSEAQCSYLLTYAGVETVKVDLDQITITSDSEPLNYGLSYKNYKLVGAEDSYSLPSYTFIGNVIESVDMSELKATNIGSFAFEHSNPALTSIVLPPNLTAIPASAFKGCSALTTVNIPEKVTSIGELAFYGCSALETVNIPANVTTIGVSAFESCSALTTVNIPEKVTSIGTIAFYGCSALTTVNIPEKVTSIGEMAFYGCTSLNSITLKCMNISSVGTDAFTGAREYLTKIILDMDYDSKLTSSSSGIFDLILNILNPNASATNIILIVPDTYSDEQIDALKTTYDVAEEVKRVSKE